MDDNRSGALDSEEFSKALKSYRITNDPLEIQAIFDRFDPDGNGEIVYDEFLREIMGPMNRRREALVKKAFKVIKAVEIFEAAEVSKARKIISEVFTINQVIEFNNLMTNITYVLKTKSWKNREISG